MKAMPGGFIGWARVSTFGPPAAVAVPWDPTRAVDRFLEEQGISEKEQVGDWARYVYFFDIEKGADIQGNTIYTGRSS